MHSPLNPTTEKKIFRNFFQRCGINRIPRTECVAKGNFARFAARMTFWTIWAKYLTTESITARVIGRCGYKSLSVSSNAKAFAFGKGRHMLKISIVPVTEYEQNCSIVYDDQSKVAVVVDPGGDIDRIAAAVDELGVRVEAVWLTHGHLDHAGGAEAAKSKFNVDIIGPHRADKLLLDNIELTAQGYGLSGMFNASP